MERRLSMIRRAFNEQDFSAAWTEGSSMSLEEATAYALCTDAVSASRISSSRNHPAQRPQGTLSAREREVAALAARGLSNRQIAGALVISERTAGNHIAHVLDKLGLSSRTQLAALASEYGIRSVSL
jgi:DNA-binding NarL/FixJ family response regulator